MLDFSIYVMRDRAHDDLEHQGSRLNGVGGCGEVEWSLLDSSIHAARSCFIGVFACFWDGPIADFCVVCFFPVVGGGDEFKERAVGGH